MTDLEGFLRKEGFLSRTLLDKNFTLDLEKHNSCNIKYLLGISKPFRYTIEGNGITDIVCPVGIIPDSFQGTKDEDIIDYNIAYIFVSSLDTTKITLSLDVSVPAIHSPKESIMGAIDIDPKEYSDDEFVMILSQALFEFQNKITIWVNALTNLTFFCTFRPDIMSTKGFNRMKNLILNLVMENDFKLPIV